MSSMRSSPSVSSLVSATEIGANRPESNCSYRIIQQLTPLFLGDRGLQQQFAVLGILLKDRCNYLQLAEKLLAQALFLRQIIKRTAISLSSLCHSFSPNSSINCSKSFS